MDNALSQIYKPTVLVMILANLIPLAGVVVLGWQVFPLMLLFWIENVIVGIINVIKMLMAEPGNRKAWASKVAMVPFFCFHYGMFTLVHGIFVFALFGGLLTDDPASGIEATPGLIDNFGLIWAVGGIALSHIISFFVNYVGHREYMTSTVQGLMMQPYGRVIILHMTILGGGFLMMLLGSPVWGLVLLISIKIVIDVVAHTKEHGLLNTAAGPAGNASM
jgi:hypothetical protein